MASSDAGTLRIESEIGRAGLEAVRLQIESELKRAAPDTKTAGAWIDHYLLTDSGGASQAQYAPSSVQFYRASGFLCSRPVDSVSLATLAPILGCKYVYVTWDVTTKETVHVFGYQPKARLPWLTGSMTTARALHTATRLRSGMVLVAGGVVGGGQALSSAELYDPATGQWAATGAMTAPRFQHTATLLPDGKVLVTGGTDGGVQALGSAEVFDPAKGQWTPVGEMTLPRFGHTATLVKGFGVLVAGGPSGSPPMTPTAEVYDLETRRWTAAGSMSMGRRHHTATLLGTGKVLVVGGVTQDSDVASGGEKGELFDPHKGTWAPTGSMSQALAYHRALLLPSGLVLVAGGCTVSMGGDFPSRTAELYDPARGTWLHTGSLAAARAKHTLTLLPSGGVLATGGFGADPGNFCMTGDPIDTVERYDPTTGSWTPVVLPMATARASHAAVACRGGDVLLVGGCGGIGGCGGTRTPLASAELYVP